MNSSHPADGPPTIGSYNVIAVSFEDDRKAYDALTLLKELDSQQQVAVGEAVAVVRQEDGQVIEKDRIESKFLPGTTGGVSSVC
jgi:uncharacterized membrane protein